METPRNYGDNTDGATLIGQRMALFNVFFFTRGY